MNYGNKAALMGAMIIAGWDERAGGQVYGCPIGGTLVRQRWSTDGSGSTYIWGYMDANYRCVGLDSVGISQQGRGGSPFASKVSVAAPSRCQECLSARA